ncbi:MAG TPA: hypothetical protein GXZ65_05000 [Clostridiales bacterium]|nr:hypothetical protein [Clostridiales bacterium]
MVNLIIFLVAVILSIVLGSKTKTNVGIWGIVFAFILGFAICKLPATKVLANFPTTLFYNFFIACLFYGFAAVNGTMEVLARKLMYFFRNVQWMAPHHAFPQRTDYLCLRFRSFCIYHSFSDGFQSGS